MAESVAIGVIGGSGLYNMPGLSDLTTQTIDTPFGKPSADIVIGTLRGKRVAFLPRHGIGHVHSPSTVPYRANICALKMLGVRHIIAVNACGSLREDYAPGHIVIPDQLVDMTKAARGRSFFEESGVVAHISVADPFCDELRVMVAESVAAVGGTVHRGGSFVIVEGPRFSTRAESQIFRQWGCSIIGMTTCPEAFLAREAEMAYATMSHITDYDVWHVSEAPVTVEMVMRTMHDNLTIAQNAVAAAIERLDENADWACHHALDNAIMTDPAVMPSAARERLRPIAGRLFGQ
ncbi:MAG: S-methyl-5'-thioadenosine phosphorylase [Chloroflexota bacterium]|nr:S-methyl-5'-thioadenosine phosphorylase [Chloroflexota bacterium]